MVSAAGPTCQSCGIPKFACCCNVLLEIPSPIQWLVLTSAKEWTRASSTSRILEHSFSSSCLRVAWARRGPSKEVEDLLSQYKSRTYILFPGDFNRVEVQVVRSQFALSPGDSKVLCILLDGTWKEARDILRHSPWLQQIPRLSLELPPQTLFALRQRKNPVVGEGCTLEAAAGLFQELGLEGESRALMHNLDVFQKHFFAGLSGHGIGLS